MIHFHQYQLMDTFTTQCRIHVTGSTKSDKNVFMCVEKHKYFEALVDQKKKYLTRYSALNTLKN